MNGNDEDGNGGVPWVATGRGQTVALSNTWLGDKSWAKVVAGEKLMEEAIAVHAATTANGSGGKNDQDDENQLIQLLLGVLSVDTLPRLEKDKTAGVPVDDYIAHLQQSIFVPVIGSTNQQTNQTHEKPHLQGLYGTQKQTVMLVGFDGRVRYFERTLYEDDCSSTKFATRDKSYEFQIEK